ncbi:putative sirq protein [Diaporthe ampelina]|uniref:Putative sirq protein n=1 Tax=Diaporthe ampelina TaxID=1214573 RepID=A0A0G2FLL9_9PEZI|nr:putative sirq protein [Diaporthe ampelina]
MAQNHAVVIGASGLIGWGVVNELLSHDYIAAGAFGTVTAIVNRPVNRDDMFWPSEHPIFRANDGDQEAEVEMNTGMMSRFIRTIESLAHAQPQIRRLPGEGTRGYGIYRPGGIFSAPLDESLIGTLPDDYAGAVAYPSSRRLLASASEGKPRTWREVCPDAVVGFRAQWQRAARFAIYAAALRPEACGGGKTFNAADAEGPGTVRERWPRIAAWFGCE